MAVTAFNLPLAANPISPSRITITGPDTPADFNSAKLVKQRQHYKQVSALIDQRQITKAKKQMKSLTDYPLYPYLEYKLLSRRLTKASIKEINQFIALYNDTLLAERLRLRAIEQKTKHRRWKDVLALSQAGDSAKYQCMRLRAVYHKVSKTSALEQVEPIWLAGSSLPKACDSLFATWRQAGYQTPDRVWQRITLAMENNKRSLARYLARSLPAPQQRDFDLWYQLYRHPDRLKQKRYWKSTHPLKSVMLPIVMKRLISKSHEKALKVWPKFEDNQEFTTKQRDKLHNRLLLKLVEKQHMAHPLWLAKADTSQLPASQLEQLLRALVKHGHWQQIQDLYQKSWPQESAPSIWQYWQARALEESNQPQVARSIYQQLAKERHYYGFLASDKLKTPYQLNQAQLSPTKAVLKGVSKTPGIARAHELLRLDRFVSARREWYQTMKRFDESQRIAAAKLASEWQWHDRAIITLTMTNARDDLGVRFPTPHLNRFTSEARRHNIDISWPLAVARQESAFMADASSSAGAMGLMQLLPSTAKRQARKSKVKYKNRNTLLDPGTNIRLGTGYLAAMLDNFDGNLAIAAAAYNAGPHRVKRWLTNELPQDRWIESIPYRETRSYVKNILAYTVIYQNHLKRTVDMPKQAINPSMMAIFNR